jgi:hypothetical protein
MFSCIHFLVSCIRFLISLSAVVGIFLLSYSLYGIGMQAKEFNSELFRFNETFVKVAEQIPSMISVVNESNQSISSLNNSVKFLDDKYHFELLAFNAEISRINNVLPSLISESVSLRKEMPLVVKEINGLLVKAQDFSSVASEGVVKGFLRGVMSLPAEVLSSVITLPFQTVQQAGQKVSSQVGPDVTEPTSAVLKDSGESQ